MSSDDEMTCSHIKISLLFRCSYSFSAADVSQSPCLRCEFDMCNCVFVLGSCHLPLRPFNHTLMYFGADTFVCRNIYKRDFGLRPYAAPRVFIVFLYLSRILAFINLSPSLVYFTGIVCTC